jgi:uncharacterized protein
MALCTDTFDLGALRLTTGEGRRLDLRVRADPFVLGGETYSVPQAEVSVRLDVSRTTGAGYALRLRFEVAIEGPCMRCLGPAAPVLEVDAREVSQPGQGDELDSPYVRREVLDLHAWTRDALALALPDRVLCQEQCAGLCPVCGADLNQAPPGHAHEQPPDPRWAALDELRFD